jgi:hypothetical protein
MRRSKMKRVEACFECRWGHLQHLLWMYSFSYDSQTECFRTQVHTDIILVLVCGTRGQSLSAPFTYTLYMARIRGLSKKKPNFLFTTFIGKLTT